MKGLGRATRWVSNNVPLVEDPPAAPCCICSNHSPKKATAIDDQQIRHHGQATGSFVCQERPDFNLETLTNHLLISKKHRSNQGIEKLSKRRLLLP